MFLFVSSLRSVDSPGLFLALVVCGDGHCWCRVHGCAHGCLRGQAAAKGDKIRVRRQFCSTWVEGRDRITVPNQSWLVFSSLTFLLHVWGHSRAEGSKKDQNPPTVTFSLCIHSFLHWQGGVRAHDGERRAGGQVPCSSDLQPQNNRSDVWVYCSASPPRPAQNNGISNICAWLSLQQWEMCLSTCTNLPLCGSIVRKGVKRGRKRRLCRLLWLNKRSGCDQLKGFWLEVKHSCEGGV